MTILYRSPNVLLDGVIWHVAVERRGKRVNTAFRWRRSEREMWQPMHAWPGRKPKGIGQRFATYRKSVLAAIAFEQRGVAA